MQNYTVLENGFLKLHSWRKKNFDGDEYFVINPYFGCMFSCNHCAAKISYRMRIKQEWCSTVIAKTNLIKQLEKSAIKLSGKNVYLSSLSDPYQEPEQTLKITQQILEILPKDVAKLRIITKSPLILRDLELLKRFNNIEIGVSIFTLQEKYINEFEKNVPSVDERIELIASLKEGGVKTFLNIYPFLPEITMLEKMISILDEDVDFIRIIPPNWKSTQIKKGVFDALKKYSPELLIRYHTKYLSNDVYSNMVSKIVKKIISSSDSIPIFYYPNP